MINNHNYVFWLFNRENGTFPSGVFADLDGAEKWIERHRLSGTLTAYPVNTGVYEWAIARGFFTPHHAHQTTPQFIGRFTSACMEHRHYEDGQRQV